MLLISFHGPGHFEIVLILWHQSLWQQSYHFVASALAQCCRGQDAQARCLSPSGSQFQSQPPLLEGTKGARTEAGVEAGCLSFKLGAGVLLGPVGCRTPAFPAFIARSPALPAPRSAPHARCAHGTNACDDLACRQDSTRTSTRTHTSAALRIAPVYECPKTSAGRT